MRNKIFLFAFSVSTFFLWSCDDDDSPEQDLPEACFEVSATTVKAGEEVTFTNCSKNAAIYAWSFGDGTFFTDTEPVHTYTEGGSYTVTLLSGSDTNTDGDLTTDDVVDAATETITVEPVVKSAELTIFDGTSWTQENSTLAVVEGAKVDLYNSQSSFDGGKPDFTVTSDENGKVVFNDLETNQYFMVVTKDGLSNIKDNFVIVGVFQNQGEIDGAPFQPGNPKPGDFRLGDLNGDGIISDDDKANYGILDYKGELIVREIVIGK